MKVYVLTGKHSDGSGYKVLAAYATQELTATTLTLLERAEALLICEITEVDCEGYE